MEFTRRPKKLFLGLKSHFKSTIMKTKNSLKIILLSLLAICSSCGDEFLDEQPRLSQTNVLSLSSYSGLENATIGIYSLLCSSYWYGEEFGIIADLKGGNSKRSPINSGRFENEYMWNNSPALTTFLWNDAYSTIARANNVINAIDAGFSEAGITTAAINQLKGECLFIRALAHWDLSRMYSQQYSSGTSNMGVPVILKTENGYPARNTVGEVYTQVVADLENAYDLLPEANPRGTDNAWANKWTARALLSKVYLYMEEWQLAADMATDVIKNGGYTMFTAADYTTWDNDGFWGSGGNGSEIIFQVDGSQGNSGHGFWECISYMMSPDGYGDIAASDDLLGLFEAGDVRGDLFVSPSNYPGIYWSLKFTGRLGSAPPLDFNFPVLRLSEMYLIRAEALLNGASVTGATALGDYNTIRTNRGLPAVATAPTLTTIYEERRRELCFEGNELFDLARTSRSLTRVDYTGSLRQNVAFVVNGSATDNYLWVMPIPQGECDANVNMVQNPLY